MNYPHIVHTEGTCGGRPRIEGTRIEVANIAAAMKQGVTLEEIAGYYPFVQPAQLLAAAAYFHDNRAEIETILHLQHSLYEAGLAKQQQREKEKIAA